MSAVNLQPVVDTTLSRQEIEVAGGEFSQFSHTDRFVVDQVVTVATSDGWQLDGYVVDAWNGQTCFVVDF
jgi:hypothetical protein